MHPSKYSSALPRHACARGRNAAFTLVELLTVIAIIGVLAAILIPTIGKMRESAKSSRCVANLRQNGVAIQTYAADTKGLLPSAGFFVPGSNQRLFSISPYLTADPRHFPNFLLAYVSVSKSGSWNTSTLVGQSYASTFDCPDYKGSPGGICYEMQRYVTIPDGTQIQPWGWTYQAGSQFITNPKPLKTSLVPAEAWAIRDRDVSITERNHSGYQNYLYFDWHVGRVAVN